MEKPAADNEPTEIELLNKILNIAQYFYDEAEEAKAISGYR